MNPYEKLQGKSTGHYVPVEVTRPDGSQYRTMAKLSNKTIEKLQELSEGKNVKDREPKETFDSPAMQQLNDAMAALERGEPVLMCGDFADGSGVKIIDYPNLMRASTEQPDAADLLHRIREMRKGDEMCMPEIDSLSHIEGGEKVVHFSTPTGRAPTDMEEMLSRHKQPVVVGASWKNGPIESDAHLLEKPYNLHPHQQATMDAIKRQAFEQGYRAGLSGKPTLSMLGLHRQIERIKNGATPLIICDERHPLVTDSLSHLERLVGNLNFGMRFSPGGHIDPRGRTHIFDYESIGGYIPDIVLKHEYMQEVERSKITDFEKRHEAICKKLLATRKKRRKAIRKILDIIGGELKNGNHDAKSDAPDSV